MHSNHSAASASLPLNLHTKEKLTKLWQLSYLLFQPFFWSILKKHHAHNCSTFGTFTFFRCSRILSTSISSKALLRAGDKENNKENVVTLPLATCLDNVTKMLLSNGNLNENSLKTVGNLSARSWSDTIDDEYFMPNFRLDHHHRLSW